MKKSLKFKITSCLLASSIIFSSSSFLSINTYAQETSTQQINVNNEQLDIKISESDQIRRALSLNQDGKVLSEATYNKVTGELTIDGVVQSTGTVEDLKSMVNNNSGTTVKGENIYRAASCTYDYLSSSSGTTKILRGTAAAISAAIAALTGGTTAAISSVVSALIGFTGDLYYNKKTYYCMDGRTVKVKYNWTFFKDSAHKKQVGSSFNTYATR